VCMIICGVCMYVYACMSLHVCMYMYVWEYMDMFLFLSICMYVRVSLYAHVCVYVCLCVCVQCMSVYVCVYVCVAIVVASITFRYASDLNNAVAIDVACMHDCVRARMWSHCVCDVVATVLLALSRKACDFTV